MRISLSFHRPSYPFQDQDGFDGVCALDLYKGALMTMVVFTEIAENTGPSITNRSALLASQVVREYALDPKHCLFVEHYNEQSYPGRIEEEYSAVTYDWHWGTASNPAWSYLPPNVFDWLRSYLRR